MEGREEIVNYLNFIKEDCDELLDNYWVLDETMGKLLTFKMGDLYMELVDIGRTMDSIIENCNKVKDIVNEILDEGE